MKKILILTTLVLTVSTIAMAQREGKTRFSIGPEIGVVTGSASNAWGFGIGASADVQHFFQENLAGVVSIGVVSYAGKSESTGLKYKNFTTIPIKVGGNFFVGNNLHLGAQIGVGLNHSGGVSYTQFAYSPQIGYNFKSKNDNSLDLTLKYDGYAGNGSFSAFGLRLSFIL